MQIVLGRIAAINVGSYLKISFGFIPIAVCGILTGPVWTLLMASVCDVLGALLFPTGAFFPGFTVSAVLTGLIFGWVLYQKEVTIVRALIASALVCLIVNLLINTYWLTIIIGKGFKVLLASRAVKEIVAIPVMAIIIVLIDRYVLKHVKNRSIS